MFQQQCTHVYAYCADNDHHLGHHDLHHRHGCWRSQPGAFDGIVLTVDDRLPTMEHTQGCSLLVQLFGTETPFLRRLHDCKLGAFQQLFVVTKMLHLALRATACLSVRVLEPERGYHTI